MYLSYWRDILTTDVIMLRPGSDVIVIDSNDSGNGSNSSSVEQLHQQMTSPSIASEERQRYDVINMADLSQSVDLLLSGYEGEDGDSEYHVPLHRTVCCSLCR